MDGETDGPQATAKSGGGRRLSFRLLQHPLANPQFSVYGLCGLVVVE